KQPLFILLRQLLPNRLPPWMAREALAQLTRHVESIQLEADPSLEILPARGNPWSAVPVDDKKIPTRTIGIFVHQKFLEAFPHLPLALMDVVALIDKFYPCAVAPPPFVNGHGFVFLGSFSLPLAGNKQSIGLHQQHPSISLAHLAV